MTGPWPVAMVGRTPVTNDEAEARETDPTSRAKDEVECMMKEEEYQPLVMKIAKRKRRKRKV